MASTCIFDRIFIVIFENELESAVRQDAFMLSLERQGVRLSDYHGVAHPSQPNYVAAIAGTTIVPDDNVHDINRNNLVDLLESKGISWKAYIENLPPNNKSVGNSPDGLYFRKHNPFISFDNIRNNGQRLAKIVNASQLAADTAANELPQFCWYTPNIQNDGHTPPGVSVGDSSGSVAFLSVWLKGFLTPLLNEPNFYNGTLIVIVFDESIPYEDNHVYATLLGKMVKAGTTESGRYDHYSLLRTIEENFQLGTLGNSDVTANWFQFLWGIKSEAFNWSRHRQ